MNCLMVLMTSMNELLDGVNDSCSNSSLTHSNKRLQPQAQKMSRKYNFAVIKSSVKFSATYVSFSLLDLLLFIFVQLSIRATILRIIFSLIHFFQREALITQKIERYFLLAVIQAVLLCLIRIV